MDKYTGKRLDGRYEIRELIGVGGMAYVYRCYDIIDDREVSIKILKDEYLNNEDFCRRFKNESKAIAMLSHPNIVKVYDVSFGDVIQYIVMEYIDGITLKEYISQQGVVDWKTTIHLVSQILSALQHAHQHGVIHRDIKPQNIMLTEDGTIKVTDFGIARFSDNNTRTMTDQAIGSVHYIAPEQAKGSVTDGQSDIYSVGVILYEMLTGKLPFDAENAVSVAIMQMQSTPKNPRELNPNIPKGLEEITLKAMQKNTSLRYKSAAEMLQAFKIFEENPEVTFDYRCFVDNQPTRYVEKIPKAMPRTDDEEPADGYGDDFNMDYGRSRGTGKSSSPKTTAPVAQPQPQAQPHQQQQPVVPVQPVVKRQPVVSAPPAREIREDIEEDDFREKPQKRSTGKFIAIGTAIGICVVAIIALIFVFVGNNGTQSVTEVDIPDFIGKQLVDVQNNSEYSFNFKIEKQYDETKELGEILDQDPKAGSGKVKPDATITLYVNGNDSPITVPNIIGYTEEQAREEIKKLNLYPQVYYVEDESSEPGKVKSTYPNEGEEVEIGSVVNIFVVKEATEDDIEVPNVIGQTLEDAKKILQEKNLKYSVETDKNSDKPKDEVIDQTPLGGGMVEKDYVVTLIVSEGVPQTKEYVFYVDLPSEETNPVNIRVVVDGVVDSANSRDNVIPAYNNTFTIELEGTGKSNVVVEINGNKYRVYEVNFDDQNVTTLESYDYEVDVTEEPTTETEEPTTEEPTTEEPTEEPTTVESTTAATETTEEETIEAEF